MSSPRLLPDPYKILGVEKDATLPQIRLAHRKLVLQCHPDKVQDPTLKAQKVDEFQKVQEAYEILSDVSRRSEYDQTVKLQKLREELGKTSTSSPNGKTYEYEVRSAEPRAASYSSSYPKSSPKIPKETNPYSKPPPRSYEDLYEEPLKQPTFRRSRTTTREPERDERERRRHEEDDRERLRRKAEKESKRDHGERRKTRDKERRRGTEDKARPPYVEEDSDDEDYRRPRAERSARKVEDTMRAEAAARVQQERERELRERELRERELLEREQREWDRRERERERDLHERNKERERDREREREIPPIKDSPMADKYKFKLENAALYVQASRREPEPKPEVPFAPAPPMPSMRRAETFAAPPTTPYNIRYETVHPSATYDNLSDDEAPRRSSAPRTSRRSTETPSRSKDTPKSSKRSTRESPYVNAPSTSPPTKPTLHKQYSEPPTVGSIRREPSRSKTEYPREPPAHIPTFSRAATFTQGMGKDDIRDRGRGAGRLKPDYTQEPETESDSGSDSDSPSPTPAYTSRPPRREAHEPNKTTYVINNSGRSELKSSSYRSDLRNRSPSPRRTTRPPLTRSGPSGARQVRSQSRGYHPTSAPDSTEPIVLTAQPKRDPSRGASRGVYTSPYNTVNYAQPITPDQVVYSTGTQYVDRRAAESGGHNRDYAYNSTPRGRDAIYT